MRVPAGWVRHHGTAVAIDGCGALLRGAPGAGKSDLALRLIERGAQLIGDDQVWVGAGQVMGDPRLRGKLEVRGVGILDVPARGPLPLFAVFDLEEPGAAGGPDDAALSPDTRIRRFTLLPFEAQAPEAVRLTVAAVAQAADGPGRPERNR